MSGTLGLKRLRSKRSRWHTQKPRQKKGVKKRTPGNFLEGYLVAIIYMSLPRVTAYDSDDVLSQNR